MEKSIVVGVNGGMVLENTEELFNQMNTVDVDRKAQVIVDLSIEIEAAQETVWRIQTEIEQWPTWQKNISHVQLSGLIEVGNTFHWETHVMG
jgi:uncharacterized membrane protein